jgi:hypothetical protein
METNKAKSTTLRTKKMSKMDPNKNTGASEVLENPASYKTPAVLLI